MGLNSALASVNVLKVVQVKQHLSRPAYAMVALGSYSMISFNSRKYHTGTQNNYSERLKLE